MKIALHASQTDGEDVELLSAGRQTLAAHAAAQIEELEAPETDESEDESDEQPERGSAEAEAVGDVDEQPKMPVEKAYKIVHQLVLGDLEGITRTMSVAGTGEEPYKDNTIMYADMTDAGFHYLQRLYCLGDRRFEDGAPV